MKTATRVISIIAVVIFLVIVTFIANLYFKLSGGTPWVKAQAQSRMVQLLKKKYQHEPFRVTSSTILDFKDNHYSIGITFNKDPSTQFFYELNPYTSFKDSGNDYFFRKSPTDTVGFEAAGPAPNTNRLKWIHKYANSDPQPPTS